MNLTLPTTLTLTSNDGLKLSCQIHAGDLKGRALPVVCLPGLSRNSRDFYNLGVKLANDPVRPRMVICPDYRGRGLSAWDTNPANYNLFQEMQDVMALLQVLDVDKAHFIGTSRGGLIMHLLAGLAPDRIASVILNDIGPALELTGMQQIRDYLTARPQPASWEQAARAMKAAHGHGFPVFDDEDWMEMARSIFTDRNGVILPDYDPALAEPLRTMDLSQPLADLWPQYESLRPLPLLVIRGEFSTLLSLATVTEMRRRIPSLEFYSAPGQAHAPILHKHGPETVITAFYRHRE